MKNYKWLLLTSAMILLFISCADTVPYEVLTDDEPYGFWGGLWHGMTVFISFFGSLFNTDISIYAINNNGGWYDFGYWIGVGALGSGIGKAFLD